MKLVFICTGNTCRSAMAQHLCEKLAKEQEKDVQAYSCGIYAEEGAPATDEAIEVMKEYQVDLTKHTATPLQKVPLQDMDYILCATTAHKQMVKMAYPELAEKMYTIKEFAYPEEKLEDKDIHDPWGYDLTTYRKCAAEIKECIQRILR